MKAVLGTATKILFYIFAAAVVVWTASLTLGMIRKVLPGDSLTPWFALALFDGGALVWLMVFIFYAKGLGQRAIALLLLVFDLGGVVLMSMGELLMSGQELTAIPEGMGTYIVYGLGMSTAINLIAGYAFHVADPATSQLIELQTEQDKIESEAMSQARARLQEASARLGAILADRLEQQAMYNLRLSSGERTADVIEGQARNATEPPKKRRWIFNKGARPVQQPAFASETIPPASLEQDPKNA